MKNPALPISVLNQTKNVKTFTKQFTEDGVEYTIKAFVRYDDTCKNGHNDFAITGEIYYFDRDRGRKVIDRCGMIHDEIRKHFPELVKYLKWHLTSTDGPMHYIANTCYWAEEGKLDNARSAAVWPEASDEVFTLTPRDMNEEKWSRDLSSLRAALEVRLPGLMLEFKDVVEELGFTY